MKTDLHIRGLACFLTKLGGLVACAALSLLLLSLGCDKKADDSKKGPAPGATLPNTDAATSTLEPQESATPLPAALVTAWTKAGAEVGYTQWHGFVDFRAGIEGKKGEVSGFLLPKWEVPAFRFSEWTDGVVSKLPQPQRAFGLSLFRTKITDAGLKELVGLKRLKILNLMSTQVTDAGLKDLATCKQLQHLVLYDTQVTDLGLKELGGLKGLQGLVLGRTRITDAGLKELAGLKGLRNLDLRETKVTGAGIAELQKALPTLQIRQ